MGFTCGTSDSSQSCFGRTSKETCSTCPAHSLMPPSSGTRESQKAWTRTYHNGTHSQGRLESPPLRSSRSSSASNHRMSSRTQKIRCEHRLNLSIKAYLINYTSKKKK